MALGVFVLLLFAIIVIIGLKSGDDNDVELPLFVTRVTTTTRVKNE